MIATICDLCGTWTKALNRSSHSGDPGLWKLSDGISDALGVVVGLLLVEMKMDEVFDEMQPDCQMERRDGYPVFVDWPNQAWRLTLQKDLVGRCGSRQRYKSLYAYRPRLEVYHQANSE
jgi:hypothetical protein